MYSPAAVEQRRWRQWYLYQAPSLTVSLWCSPSHRCRSLVPVPAASWLDLWAWDHDSYHGQGFHPCPYGGSEWSSPPNLMGSHRSWKQTLSCQLNSFLTSSFQHLNYDTRWANSLTAFHLSECSTDQGRKHTGREASCKEDLRVAIWHWAA